MTDVETYMYLGSHPCEDCSSCNVDEKLNHIENSGIKPRHCKNGYEMVSYCEENYPCGEAKTWNEQYYDLINE